MNLYFAYGSNMSTPRLKARIALARPLGRAFVDGWQLAFNKPGRDGTSKANLVEIADARTWGVLFELPAEAWPVLDRFEMGYERCTFRFERSSAGPLEALAYVYSASAVATADAPGAPRSIGAPSAEYIGHLLAGAREHGLPAAHIAWISSLGG